MLMELVGILLFLNEYGELETVKPGNREETSVLTTVGASGSGVMLTVSFLDIIV